MGSAQPLRGIVEVRQLLSSHAALFGLDSKRRALRARRLLSIAVLEGLVFSIIAVERALVAEVRGMRGLPAR